MNTTTDNQLPAEFRQRIVRYDSLKPQRLSFIDTRTSGSEGKETFQVIGPGVVENQNRFIHIPIPHGFNMGGARMPPGVINGQHSHLTAEVFLVHRGQFTFTFGPNRDDGEVEIGLGGVVSIPTNVFRGFRNSGDNTGHLVSTIGEDKPGKVTWAPYVFRDAAEGGLVLTEKGVLVDTHNGESIPDGDAPVTPTSEEDIQGFDRPHPGDLDGWYLRASDIAPCKTAPLKSDGVDECLVLGCANPLENVPAAPISAAHGFHIRRVRMAPAARIPAHTRSQVEVLFIHAGQVQISVDGADVVLNKGDYFSLPVGAYRRWVNSGPDSNDIHVVHGGDQPAAPVWRQ